MSQFEGGNKVRCVDCTKLSGKTCTAKKTTVAPKKRRACAAYEFKGEYENRTPLPAEYMPPVDKKTLKAIRRLLKMGVVTPDADTGDLSMKEGFYKQKTLEVPSSTATAGVIDPIPDDKKTREVLATSAIFKQDEEERRKSFKPPGISPAEEGNEDGQ